MTGSPAEGNFVPILRGLGGDGEDHGRARARAAAPSPARDRGTAHLLCWAGMETLPLRLTPGMDLRRELENALGARGARAAFVVCGIGSLREARLRLAGATEASELAGPLEILTLAGSIAADGSHLHVSVADGAGNVSGGHAGYGCVVRTT